MYRVFPREPKSGICAYLQFWWNPDASKILKVSCEVRKVVLSKQKLLLSHFLCSAAIMQRKRTGLKWQESLLNVSFSDLEEAGSNTSRFSLHNLKAKDQNKLSSLFSNQKVMKILLHQQKKTEENNWRGKRNRIFALKRQSECEARVISASNRGVSTLGFNFTCFSPRCYLSRGQSQLHSSGHARPFTRAVKSPRPVERIRC